ncbi:MAG: hypothetical protein AAGE84_11625 [Cyanobacteria bacterium P01_G01_bin.39]
MTITLAKWTINEYHSMIEAGLLDNRQVELLIRWSYLLQGNRIKIFNQNMPELDKI